MSGTTAEPAAGQGSTEVSKGGWVTQVCACRRSPDPAVRAPRAVRRSKRTRLPARKTCSCPVRSTTRTTMPRRTSTSTAPRAWSIRRARPSSWVASNTPPAPYEESSTLFGQLNPLLPGLAVYGDWRTAVAYNSNNGKDIAQIATRLNIDVDFKTHRHRTHPRLLHAASEEQRIHPLRVRRRRRQQQVQRRVRPQPADAVLRG